jgi:hypothetical protein
MPLPRPLPKDGGDARREDALVRAPAPYRDERQSLLAENARLNREIARRRRRRVWPAVASIGAYVVLLTQLRDWLNGTDPVRYWIALLSLIVALGAGAASVVVYIFGGRD